MLRGRFWGSGKRVGGDKWVLREEQVCEGLGVLVEGGDDEILWRLHGDLYFGFLGTNSQFCLCPQYPHSINMICLSTSTLHILIVLFALTPL